MNTATLHLVAHFVVPLIVSVLCFRGQWQRAYLLMLSAFIIDLDHLLATPIYDPTRCGVGFHPLHSAMATVAYVLALIPNSSRLFGIGALIHIGLDSIDCQVTNNIWYTP